MFVWTNSLRAAVGMLFNQIRSNGPRCYLSISGQIDECSEKIRLSKFQCVNYYPEFCVEIYLLKKLQFFLLQVVKLGLP